MKSRLGTSSQVVNPMPIKGYKQSQDHKSKHLTRIRGDGNGNWKGLRGERRLRTAVDKQHTKGLHLQRNYGITLQEYENMFREQGGRCIICGMETEKLSVDHSHLTGNVRGLLCRLCNVGLGHFRDSIELLNKAVDYLEKNK